MPAHNQPAQSMLRRLHDAHDRQNLRDLLVCGSSERCDILPRVTQLSSPASPLTWLHLSQERHGTQSLASCGRAQFEG